MKTKVPPLNLRAEFKEIRSEFVSRANQIFSSGRYILGAEAAKFEKTLAHFVGTQYAVGVASGSDALLLSLMAFGVKQGDEIITTPFSFIATATAIARLGAKPVFVDIDPDTFNLNPGLIRRKITKRTRGIIVVHLYGNPCQMDEILKTTKQSGLFVVEDCAQACGAAFLKKQVGSFGNFGAFSFYPTKTMGAMGDAGALTMNDKKLYEKIKSLHLHGEEKDKHSDRSYLHTTIGINSRLDEIQAAVLNVKLKFLRRWNQKRRSAATRYHQLLSKFGLSSPRRRGSTSVDSRLRGNDTNHIIPPSETYRGQSVYHQYVIRTPKRDALLNYLKHQGISAGVYYPIPLHLQPCFRYLGYRRGDLPEAEKAGREVLSLPLYPQIPLKNQKLVASKIQNFISKASL